MSNIKIEDFIAGIFISGERELSGLYEKLLNAEESRDGSVKFWQPFEEWPAAEVISEVDSLVDRYNQIFKNKEDVK